MNRDNAKALKGPVSTGNQPGVRTVQITGKNGGTFHASTIHKIVGNDLHHAKG